MPTKDTLTTLKRRFYLTFTVIGIVLLIAAAVYAIGQIWTAISIVLFSAFLVFILRAPVAWLERHRVPRVLGSGLMYIFALLIIVMILLVFVPVITEQFAGFLQSLPTYLEQANNFWNDIIAQYNAFFQDSTIQQLLSSIESEATKWVTNAASMSASAMILTASSVTTGLVVAGVSTIVGFWVLKDLPRFSAEIMIIVGPKYEQDAKVISGAFSRALGGYLRGMVVSCLCTGTLAGICYTILGIPYPVIMAFFTGLMVFIPVIGPTLAWILAGLIGLFISPLTGILAAGLTIASQMTNDNLIYPRVMSGTVELHPAIMLVAIFIGATLGGIFGMLCAVPLASALKSIFVYYFEKRTGRQLVSEKGALFRGHPPKHDVDPPALEQEPKQ
ncbi:MAG: AI-2E family transporter [Coriobacteriales bacterium]|nr:AI-2E family transporter [Coriobacteriales bacterium]